MAVTYKKLFHLLIDRGIPTAELTEKAGFSANILTRLRRDQYVSLDSIEKICLALGCKVDENPVNSTGRYRTRQFSAIFESDSELRYQDEIHGSLISRADKVVDLIFTKYLKADISYQGVTRVETCPFPKEAIREEPSLSQKKIADVIGEKYSTVKYYMESMKKSGIIKREGSSQKGKWIIL